MEINLLINDNISHDLKADNNLLIRDLKLSVLFDVISGGDSELYKICSQVLLNPSTKDTEILKRQAVLRDGIAHTEQFQSIYRSALGAAQKVKEYEDAVKHQYNYVIPVPKKILTQVETAFTILEYLGEIKNSVNQIKNPESERLSSFCHWFTGKYTKDYIDEVRNILQSLTVLKKTDAITIGAHIGKGLKLTDMTLHRILINEALPQEKKGLLLFGHKSENVDEIKIDNITIENEVREMIDVGLTWVLKAVSDFNYSVKYLLEQLKFQFGFYCGGLNLHKYLSERKISICFPEFTDTCNCLSVSTLSDLFLVIKEGLAVTNSLSYRDKSNWIITGVNQGGKTTFLRSIGIAQFLAQSGYFVAAEQYKCNLYQGIFTHFPEEEDTAIKHGLLEQELLKLSDIITCITPGSLLLLNETFATTTDYDAAYLAEELLAGIRGSNITCLYVTHNYEFSYRLYRDNRTEDVFLRADRADDGTRSFRLIEGEPRKTGHALDLYREVMGSEVC